MRQPDNAMRKSDRQIQRGPDWTTAKDDVAMNAILPLAESYVPSFAGAAIMFLRSQPFLDPAHDRMVRGCLKSETSLQAFIAATMTH